jgi:hypothetical protein
MGRTHTHGKYKGKLCFMGPNFSDIKMFPNNRTSLLIYPGLEQFKIGLLDKNIKNF